MKYIKVQSLVSFYLVKRMNYFSSELFSLTPCTFCESMQVGAELQFRVLGCKSKIITVTHKKTLVCFLRTSLIPLVGLALFHLVFIHQLKTSFKHP